MNECKSKKKFLIIKDISISGNKYVSREEVLSRISLKIGDVFSKEKIEKDMKAVYDLGYFKDVKIKLESFQDGCKVIFVVVENLPIKEIIIQGNSVVSLGDIRETMVLQEGKIFSHKGLKNDLERISELYKAKEFLLARIEEIDFDDKGTLLIKLSEGRLEKIKIIGNKNIDQKIIQGEIEIKVGDIFNFGKVKNR
jgi:outer membrane protein insertion porin family